MDAELELNKRHSDLQQKYAFFLLTAVGACIGFAITQTTNTPLNWSKLPLGLAFILWGLSFNLGCGYLRVKDSAIQANVELIKFTTGKHPNAGSDSVRISKGANAMREMLTKYRKKSSLLYKWQLRTLQLGVFSYVVWHVYEMSLRVA
jgi:hypothetical protein